MAHDSRGRSEIALLCRALLCVGLLAALPRTARAQAAIEAETRAEIHSVWPTLDEIVLAEAPSRWGTGPVEVVADPSDANSWFLLARAIDTERVPAALQRWIGRRVEIGLADGRVCSSTVTSLRLVAVGAPDAREERAYTRIAVDEPSPEGPLHERFARTLWPRSQAFVVASTEPGCARGRWAWPLDAAVAAHALPEPVAPDTPLHQAAWAAFRALPAHARIQLAWARSPARLTRSAQWDAVEGPPIVRRFTVG
ncbi:MAG: hypothetical protein K1X94_23785, partial [Sandaracinaceae bacterium]|nr:hypothetical protein [Sandaracinaceae bacterium]